MNIFINENDSILEKIVEKIPYITKEINKKNYTNLKKNIKRNNNNIGFLRFYLFSDSGEKTLFNFYIFPKNIKIKDYPTDEQKYKYQLFLAKMFSIRDKYILKEKSNYLADYKIISKLKYNELSDLFYYLKEKEIINALDRIKIFIKNEKKPNNKIINGIDIKKNIKNINKAIILKNIKNKHEITIFTFILGNIKLLIKKNINKEIKDKALLILKLLSGIENKIIDFNEANKKGLFNNYNKIIKKDLDLIFNKNGSIFFENIENVEDVDIFLIDPKILFEYYVYDYVKKDYNIVELCKNKDKKTSKFTIKKIYDDYKESRDRGSEPDLICKKEDIDIYDIKWKILNNDDYPEESDILKLKRDIDVYAYKNNVDKNKIKAGLFYPKLNNEKNYIYYQEYDDFKVNIKFINI